MVLLAFALLLDWFVGDPDFLWRRMPHPVVIMGRFINWVDQWRSDEMLPQRYNLTRERFDLWAGGFLVIALLIATLIVIWSLHFVAGSFFIAIELVIVAILIAQKSLKDHVQAVVSGLHSGGIEGGRQAVAMIVGRDVSTLDKSGVSKAAIESLAENFSDGVVAPAFWYAVGGLPGIVFYKAVNTADSMIGHRTVRHEYFGKAAARLDDVMNWPAARLSAAIIALASLFAGAVKPRDVWETAMRDAALHRSPNAGWPEAAFAAALGISLGGPRRYSDDIVVAAPLNPRGRMKIDISDVSAALVLFRRCCLVLIGLCFFLGFAF